MFLAQCAEYIGASMAKGTLGSMISVGVFALIGIYAILGTYYGIIRGFSKSVIRLFTVGASAVCSLLVVMGISRLIVSGATVGTDKAQSVEDLLNSYAPDLVSSLPNTVTPILAEMDASTATIFVMMVIAILISPLLFIGFFYIFKIATVFLYELLSGLSGAISYGRNAVSIICGGLVGLIQGLGIAAVIIIPISGLCNIATDAREPLIGNAEEPNEYIQQAYDLVIDDLADNPVFDLVDQFGGSVAYEKMITVRINGETKDMGDECVGAIKVLANLIPVVNTEVDWTNPSDEVKDALENTVADVGENELIASLVSDVMRGVAVAAKNGSLVVDLSGAAKTIVDDILTMFSTCTKDTIEGDLDVIVDVYVIMCDRNMFGTLSSGDPEAVRHLLIDKDESGNTAVDLLLNRLNAYDRAHPIVTSLTKLSFSMMHESMGFDSDMEEIYENVKGDISSALSHNKSDFATEEEYKDAVSADLDKALADNNLVIEEDVKQNMVDYIADNYGDHEGEITDKEINDALLSYYKSYADSLANGEEPTLPDQIPGEGGEG